MASKNNILRSSKKRFKKLMKEWESLFFYGSEIDRWLPEIILLPYISLQWKQNPTWYRIIGPPGSGKSHHLKVLEDFELTYEIDNFTPKSLISGFRRNDGEDPSTLPQMNGKVVIISDESTFMEQRQEDRNVVQSILRKAYDGKVTQTFGNIKEKVVHYSHFNLLVGSTPSIDRYFLYNQALGERYINYRLQIPDRRALVSRAFDNQFIQFDAKFDMLKKHTHQFIRKLPEIGMDEIKISSEVKDLFVDCANFIALIRSHITRDASGRHVTTLPQPESAGRLVKQMTQTAISSAIIHGDMTLKRKHISRAIYFGVGSITAVTIFILYHIWCGVKNTGICKEASWFSVQHMVLLTALGRGTMSHILEDFAIHRLLMIRQGRKQGGRQIEYALSKESFDIINDISLFEKYIPPCKEILDLKNLSRLDKTRPIGNVTKKKKKKK